MKKDIFLDFRQKLCDAINNSQLPPSATYFILKDVYLEMQDVYSKYVNTQSLLNGEEETITKEVSVPLEDLENIKEEE